MAAIRLPKPGTDLGPCEEPCDHTDCAETRRFAETPCVSCGQPVGYERRLYHSAERDGLLHADCWHEEFAAAMHKRAGVA